MKGEWAIHYRRLDDPQVWHTMRYWRSDGVLVSAKTYDQVYKFNRWKEACEFCKNLITGGGFAGFLSSLITTTVIIGFLGGILGLIMGLIGGGVVGSSWGKEELKQSKNQVIDIDKEE